MLNSWHCAVRLYSKGYLKGELGQLQCFIIVHLSFGQGHSFFSSKHEFIFALKDKTLCKNCVSTFESCHSNVFYNFVLSYKSFFRLYVVKLNVHFSSAILFNAHDTTLIPFI